jgi:hypothetical protein
MPTLIQTQMERERERERERDNREYKRRQSMISSRKRMPNRTYRNPKLNSIVSDNLDFRLFMAWQ